MSEGKGRSLLFKLFSGSKEAKEGSNLQDEAAADSAAKPQQTELERAGLVMTDEAAKVAAQEQLEQMPEDDFKARAAELLARQSQSFGQRTGDAPPPVVEELNEDGTPKPINAQVQVTISPNGMEAYIAAYPPRNGGAEANPRSIRQAIVDAGVTTGILDRVLFDMAINKPYGKGKLLVAKGTPKQDGAHGSITEHFGRNLEIAPLQNNDGTVDFKQMNIIREIMAGTVISTMTPPTEGEDGQTVRGEPIKAVPGKPVTVPKGANTVLSEDGLELTAAANGHLNFKDGKFQVETVFVVEESIDNNTGNITFCGDVLVKGDMREGYEIRSQGTVTVKGIVEGASIYADGDVILTGGFNGMKRGEVQSQKRITSKFLQNCTVYAKEDIITEAIINSVVDCDALINCTKGKGTIVGGRITALHTVEANTIGSDVNTPTSITVGLSPTIIFEKASLEKEAKEIEESQEALRKNLIYLERCAKMGPLNAKNLALVETCNKQKVLTLVQESQCKRKLAEITTLIEEAAAGSWVRAKVVYPSTKITIQNLSYMTKDVCNRAIFRRDEGEIRFSTF